MRLIDLSQPIYNECPNCPAHPPVSSQVVVDHPQDGWRMELLHLASHTGSHVDAPLHKIAGGASLSDMALESFVGRAIIADLRGIQADTPIGEELLRPALPDDLRDIIVLLATGWGDKRARSEEWLYHSPHLSPDGAAWLTSKQIRAVGIDHYAIGGSRPENDVPVHEILLGAGLWIIEELRFPDEVFALPQPLQFWALPVNFKEHSGAFCRPVIVADG